MANDETKKLQTSSSRQIITVEFDTTVSSEILKSIPGVESVKNVSGNTWQLISSSTADMRKQVFDLAVKNKLSVLTLNKEEQKIEDIFKELTKKP